MFLHKNKAFTLAELMIAFTVIGIIAAIVIPILYVASPDQPEVKARKAYNSFVRSMEALTNGAPYDMNDGILDASAFSIEATSGTPRADFFCNNLANYMNAKYNNCNIEGDTSVRMRSNQVNVAYADGTGCTTENNCHQNLRFVADGIGGPHYDYDSLRQALDGLCVNYFVSHHERSDYNFITSDHVGWAVQKDDFSLSGEDIAAPLENEDGTIQHFNAFHTYAGVRTYTLYTAVCINTSNNLFPDFQNNDERQTFREHNNVYAIGVNREGKILPGAKLKTLIDNTVTR